MKWSPQQDKAMKAVAAWLKDPAGKQTFYLAGFAGTGKTTLAKHLAEDIGAVCFAAFTGFAALPSPSTKRPWASVLGFSTFDDLSVAVVEARFKKLAKERHPDAGGSAAAMSELNQARADALKEIGG